MAQPTPYSRQYNFTNFQAVSPTSPLPANYVDLELNSVKATLDALLNNLKLIQRDDTALANGTVGFDQLKAELNGFGFNPPTTWATNKQYVVRDTVFEGAGFYQCLISHVSGTFADDLTAGDWQLVADFTSATTDAANSATAAAASATTATTEAGTATTQATAAASSATSAATSASSASSSASSASTSATAAATSATNASNSASSASSSATSASTSATNAAASATAAAASAGANTMMPVQINAATETALSDSDESGWRQASSGNLIKRSWANVKAALQTLFDARYTQPGQFGWGAAAGAGTPSMAIPSNDYNQAIVAGVYSGAGSSAVNGPPGEGQYGPMVVTRRAGGSVVQTVAWGDAADSMEIYTRASGDGGSTWGSWATVYNDQKHATQILPEPTASDSTTDFNTLLTPGWAPHLMSGNAPNGWGNSNFAYVLTLYYAPNTNYTQLAFGYGSGGGQTACWIRQRFSGTWSGWSEIFTSGTGIPWSSILSPITGVPSTTTMPVGWSGDCTVVTSSVSSGASTAGSNLKPVGSSVSQSGTWLNLSGGTIAASGVGLFVRTA